MGRISTEMVSPTLSPSSQPQVSIMAPRHARSITNEFCTVVPFKSIFGLALSKEHVPRINDSKLGSCPKTYHASKVGGVSRLAVHSSAPMDTHGHSSQAIHHSPFITGHSLQAITRRSLLKSLGFLGFLSVFFLFALGWLFTRSTGTQTLGWGTLLRDIGHIRHF